MVSPAVLSLPAEWADGVLIPDRHAEPAPETGGEEGGWEVGVRGVGKGREPGAGSRVAVEDEVGLPMNFYLVTGHEIAESAGLDRGGQRLFGRRRETRP